MFKFFQNRRKPMENEAKKDEQKDVKETETETTEKKMNETDGKVKEETKTEDVKKEEVGKHDEDTKTAETENDGAGEVSAVEEAQQPNAIRVEDLVTKADLADQLSALQAKLDAIIKENQDLISQRDELKDKYEDHDFGAEGKRGYGDGGKKVPYESFEEYSKQFK